MWLRPLEGVLRTAERWRWDVEIFEWAHPPLRKTEYSAGSAAQHHQYCSCRFCWPQQAAVAMACSCHTLGMYLWLTPTRGVTSATLMTAGPHPRQPATSQSVEAVRGAANHSDRLRARIFSQLVVSGKHGNLCDPAPSSGKARCHCAATVGDGRPRCEWLIFHPLPFEHSSVARHECSLAGADGRGGGKRPDPRRVVPLYHRTRFMNCLNPWKSQIPNPAWRERNQRITSYQHTVHIPPPIPPVHPLDSSQRTTVSQNS